MVITRMTVCFFKDSTASFIKDMNSLINQGCLFCDGKPYTIVAPLADLDRIGIINLAIKLKVPLDLTWAAIMLAKHIVEDAMPVKVDLKRLDFYG